MYYSCFVVYYDADIQKAIKKGSLPKNVAALFRSTFEVLDSTRDLNLFDIKQLTSNTETVFYRLRKGKDRAIFIINDDEFYVLDIAKRDEVYKRWP
jgi:mRNA interferase RelE/StbE